MADNRTVFLVNTFIAHTVLLLNNFSAVCEDKLADVHLRILRLEATTTLLESKLDSVARSRVEAGRASEEGTRTSSETLTA
ncbi:hypothetical protein M758_2G089500 [Ceratodon purpureus]|uniref:Uncharacterized protein n=1 Tax=Ceratodon purpureus TaxID=3225 RepID=A0A8T0IT43_CERPU|nr:hypothetical protein KC19_2G080100 [Ceratodon purpureus]KAG0625932.1 hypothetical protein M758_2G089500 [Ceratodon purpureus]